MFPLFSEIKLHARQCKARQPFWTDRVWWYGAGLVKGPDGGASAWRSSPVFKEGYGMGEGIGLFVQSWVAGSANERLKGVVGMMKM